MSLGAIAVVAIVLALLLRGAASPQKQLAAGVRRIRWTQVGDAGDDRWIRDPNGKHVSSLCEDDGHAPLFELPAEAELVRGVHGASQLVIHQTVSIAHAHAVIESMESLGFAPREAAKRFIEDHTYVTEHDGSPGRHYSEWLPDLRIALAVPAEAAVRLSGRTHVFIDQSIAWPRFEELLRRMVDARLLDREWFEASRRRKMALLRLPGVPD